ncbi:hypothetical protein FHS78_001947 [Parvibaculum indicum]|uniref:plasmid recombination protein n=1 Tax=Parvibaculum indicum TaxID=562969 RepID=UPI0014246FFC|nr:plasmid recombination protein [Parvibaculum indicum]NIJ41657.1 hypothetical protein [Parvibaculum indicum]
MPDIRPVLKIKKYHIRQEMESGHTYRVGRSASRQPAWTNPQGKILAAKGGKGFDHFLIELVCLFMKRRIKPRRNSVLVVEVVLSVSPLFFFDPLAFGEDVAINEGRVNAFVRAAVKFLNGKFDGQIGDAELHQDEQIPHMHNLVVPITSDNRLSARDVFTPKTLEQMHTDYAEHLKHLGISRAVRGSKRIATEPRDFRKTCDAPGFDLPMLPLVRPAESLVMQNREVDRWNAQYAVDRVTSMFRALESKEYERVLYGSTRAQQRTDLYGPDPVFPPFPLATWSDLCTRAEKIRSVRRRHEEMPLLPKAALERIFLSIKDTIEKRTDQCVEDIFSPHDVRSAVGVVLSGLFEEFNEKPEMTFDRIVNGIQAKFDRTHDAPDPALDDDDESEQEAAQVLRPQGPMASGDDAPVEQPRSPRAPKDTATPRMEPVHETPHPDFPERPVGKKRKKIMDDPYVTIPERIRKAPEDIEADEEFRQDNTDAQERRPDDEDDFSPGFGM